MIPSRRWGTEVRHVQTWGTRPNMKFRMEVPEKESAFIGLLVRGLVYTAGDSNKG
jgi:hypothetical protein